jgi:hypothetical protein
MRHTFVSLAALVTLTAAGACNRYAAADPSWQGFRRCAGRNGIHVASQR